MESNLTERDVMGWKNRRGWIEIVYMMLQICEKGAVKTRVMYMTDLNSKQIGLYFQYLEKRKFVERVTVKTSHRPLYRTTAKGKEYIKRYRKLEEIFKQEPQDDEKTR